jgi:hypothetical protein
MALDTFEHSAARMDAIAAQLELARQHAATAALRFREALPPRAGAHAFAAMGHIRQARNLLDEAAIAFAQHSEPHEADEAPRDTAD